MLSQSTHDLITRTYDVASSLISKHELMSEIADFFVVPAAALISTSTVAGPYLICCGAGNKVAGGDRFVRDLRSNLSDKRMDHWVVSNFSANLESPDGRQYTLLLDVDAVSPDGHDTKNAHANALLPHIVRSTNLSELSDRSVRIAPQVVESLNEQLAPATVILDATSQITEINDQAISLLQSFNGIKKIGSRLEILEPSMARQFRMHLQSQLADPAAKPAFLSISEHDGLNSLTLLLKRRENPTCQVVIHMRCLKSASLNVPAHVIQKFHLSPKEVRLTTGFLQGKSLRQLASEFNVSTHTLRAQTKSIFKKTKVNSQAALILLVLDDRSSVFEFLMSSGEE